MAWQSPLPRSPQKNSGRAAHQQQQGPEPASWASCARHSPPTALTWLLGEAVAVRGHARTHSGARQQ